MLKWEMQCAGDTSGSTAEIPFGFAKRPSDGVEYPMQSWVRLGNLTVINDGKIWLTTRWIPACASRFCARRAMRTTRPRSARRKSTILLSTRDGKLCVLPCAPAALSPMEASRRGMLLNQPYFALHETFHPEGALPTSASFAETSGALPYRAQVRGRTVAESESFIYTRQMGKAPSPAAIFWGIHSRLSLAPHEIAALLFSESGACQRVDLLEESLE